MVEFWISETGISFVLNTQHMAELTLHDRNDER
jgi:hypothetical protein